MRKAHTIATLVCLVGSAAYTSNSARAQAQRGTASAQEHLNRAADAILTGRARSHAPLKEAGLPR